MNLRRITLRLLVLGVFTLAFTSFAQAQATRTWVSGVGDDVNPCSRTAPCKTLAGAISKTAINGEIDALDPGGFGTLTITKSITIDGTGTFLSVLASGAPACFTINLTSVVGNDPLSTVRLRGISCNGSGLSGAIGTHTGTRGINVSTANTRQIKLIVQDMQIFGFVNEGILFASNGGQLVVDNSAIFDNGTKGIMVDSSGANANFATIQDTHMVLNQEGLRAETNARISCKDCDVSNNTNGVVSATVGGTAEINLTDSMVANNNQFGISSDGSGGSSIIRINNTMVTNNTGAVGALGLRTVNGGTITSTGNNMIDGNTSNGTVSGPAGKQ